MHSWKLAKETLESIFVRKSYTAFKVQHLMMPPTLQ